MRRPQASLTGSSSDSVCKGAWWPVANYTFDELVVKTMPHVSPPWLQIARLLESFLYGY